MVPGGVFFPFVVTNGLEVNPAHRRHLSDLQPSRNHTSSLIIVNPTVRYRVKGQCRRLQDEAIFAQPPMTTLRELGLLFLRLGTTAFGGPAAHIAMMQDEVVRRRSWLTHQDFLDLLGATNLIPGPNSTEMAIHIGHSGEGGLGCS